MPVCLCSIYFLIMNDMPNALGKTVLNQALTLWHTPKKIIIAFITKSRLLQVHYITKQNFNMDGIRLWRFCMIRYTIRKGGTRNDRFS